MNVFGYDPGLLTYERVNFLPHMKDFKIQSVYLYVNSPGSCTNMVYLYHVCSSNISSIIKMSFGFYSLCLGFT